MIFENDARGECKPAFGTGGEEIEMKHIITTHFLLPNLYST
jgi:hypothetical protein